jgi:protein-S-isoprenylcysteine O-methyltransferase Ste14
MEDESVIAKAILAFVLMPLMVAFVIPLAFLRPPESARTFHVAAVVPLVVGTLLLLWCVRDFYVSGKGTLAPWSPPQHLVVVGLYRWSRNPMYISVVLILLGWAAAYRSTALLGYAVFFMVTFYVRVVIFEEPWLARRYGEQWEDYRAHVPRWFG